jgi:hypothetical protein
MADFDNRFSVRSPFWMLKAFPSIRVGPLAGLRRRDDPGMTIS